MNHSMTRPSLLQKAIDPFERGAFVASANYILENTRVI